MHLFFYDCIIILFDPWFFHYLFFYSYVLLLFYSIPLLFYSSILLFFKSTIYTTRNNIKHGLSHVAKVLAARSSRHSDSHPKLTPLRAIDLLIARAGPKRKGVGQTTLREILWELCPAISGDSATPNDRGPSISSLRIPYERDRVQVISKAMVLAEKRFC